ncbi:MAG: helix-turn-helix domain-containing protein [Methanoregulaceae archaeon]
MEPFPPILLGSLKKLGLSNNEARTYAALIMVTAAEVKELVDFLDISKPSIYESLEQLEEMGLAVKQNSRPVMYRPVPPETGIMNLLERQSKCGNVAIRELKKLEKRKVTIDRSDAVWTIFGNSNIEAKIKSMIRSARHSIECRIAERYLPFFKGVPVGKISLSLVVLSDNPLVEQELEKIFPGHSGDSVRVVSIEQLKAGFAECHPDGFPVPAVMNFENELNLIIDDTELLFILPMIEGQLTGLNTLNKGMILHTKMIIMGSPWERTNIGNP